MESMSGIHGDLRTWKSHDKVFYYMCVFLEKRTFGFSKGSLKTNKKKVNNQCSETWQGLGKAAVVNVHQTTVRW